jgi:GT2 family glycosyltransferase
MAETTKPAKKETASPAGAISFLVFEEQKYRATNPDVEKAVQRGQHRSLHEHWRSLGRVEHLSGKRRVGCPAYEIHFDETAYLRAFPDVAQALGAKALQAAFGYWMRHGLRETLAGERPDVLGIRKRGTECFLRTLLLAGEHVSVFAVPVAAAAERFEITARAADGSWPRLENLEVKNVRSSSGGLNGAEHWIAGVFSSKAVPAQLFVASGSGQGAWREHLIAPVLGVAAESAPGPGGATLFQALRNSALFRPHLKALLELFQPTRGEVNRAQEFYVDTVELLSSSYLRCSGWAVGRLEPWASIHVDVGGDSVEIHPSRCLRHRRPDLLKLQGMSEEDVYEAGFFCLEPLPRADPAVSSAIVIATSASNFWWREVKVNHLNDSPDALIRHCIAHMPLERPGQLVPFLRAGAGKVFAELIERRAESLPKTSTEVVFGVTPDAPAVSIIIPLYERIDFLKHQLAHFSQDPELRSAEIIYVLDDPKHREWALRLAELSWTLFQVPFKFVLLPSNHGYGGANNAGAARATAPHLVLLNSDILPMDHGWTRALTAPLADPGIGAVGARLLYHDGTIQHDGMAYKRNQRQSTFGGLVECVHPGKGVVPNPLRGGQADAPAVTGACLALRRADFEQAGGFSGSYFVGDYEDSDLCLTIRQQRKRIVVNRDCVLFHLERQSVPRGADSTVISVINAYIHEQKWADTLNELLKGQVAT